MSNSFSSVMRLGRDAEVKNVGNTTVCEFSGAVTTGFGNRKATMWIKAKVWGKQGEAVAKYLTTGKQVWCAGELTQREYDAKDGHRMTSRRRSDERHYLLRLDPRGLPRRVADHRLIRPLHGPLVDRRPAPGRRLAAPGSRWKRA